MFLEEKFREKNQNKYFFCFLFLLFVFFMNPIKVYALGHNIDTSTVEKTFAETLQLSSSKTLYASSGVLGYYHFGETEKIAQYRNYYEASFGAVDDMDAFIDYCIDQGCKFGEDLICYPDCTVFEEYTREITGGQADNSKVRVSHKKKVTGWLYLYCDSARFYEWVDNRASIDEAYIPKLYMPDGSTSLITIFPASYFYGTISSIIREDEYGTGDGKVISQVFNQAYSTEGSALNCISSAYRWGIHDIDDFRGLNGQFDVALDNQVNGHSLAKDDAWLLGFLVGPVVENGHMTEGISFDSWAEASGLGGYVMTWGNVKEAVNDNFNALNNYMDIDYVMSVNQIPCRAFKVSTQLLGIDKLYTGYTSSVNLGKMKCPSMDWGKILNVSSTVTRLSWLLGLTNDELTHDNLQNFYYNAAISTNVDANFVRTPYGNGNMRYVWCADATKLMAATTGFFPRDVQSASWNISDYPLTLIDDYYKNHRTLKNYATYGNDMYFDLSDEDKILSVITMIQDNPALGAKLVAIHRNGNRNTTGTIQDILWLNQLGQTNYDEWCNTVISMGNVLFKCCTVSACSSTGWSITIGMVRNNNRYEYNDLNVGICLVKNIPERVEDLVLSNSYNTNISTYEVDSNYNYTGRNVIDWMHGTSDTLMTGLTTATSGGRSSVSNDLSADTKIDLTSSWSKYDINCSVNFNRTKALSLSKNGNNIMEIPENSALAQQFDANPESIVYETYVFVGRAPEGNPNTEVKTSQFKVLATPSYNNFDIDFDASSDVNTLARSSILSSAKDGSAVETLNVSFANFQTDYNTNVLFHYYKTGTNYSSNTFQITGTLVGIQKMDKTSLAEYEYQNYPEFGINAKGYLGLKPETAYFVPASGNVDVEPGDVLAYKFDYVFPSSTKLKSEIAKNTNSSIELKSILNEGEWYTDYGSVLMVDLDFSLVPTYSTAEDWGKINVNSNNDWTRMRLKTPVMRNIFFTSATVYLDNAIYTSHNSGISNEGGIPVTKGNVSTRVTEFEVPSSVILSGNTGGTDDYAINRIWLDVKWRVWSRGVPINQIDANTYNYVDYNNQFTQSSSSANTYNDGTKVNGKVTATGTDYKDLALSSTPTDALSIKLNTDILNSAKDKTISVTVPNNETNQYKNDWEIVNLTIEVADKDNSVMDLFLVSGGSILNDPNVYRGSGNANIAQIIEPTSGCTLYAVVRREAPEDKEFDERGKYIDSSENVGRFTYVLQKGDGTSATTIKKTVSASNAKAFSLGRYQGVVFGQFDRMGEYLLFSTTISGEIRELKATFDYRNADDINYDYEDSTISNNSWTEMWATSKNPDYSIVTLDGTQNQKCNTSLAPTVTFKLAQGNANFTETSTVRFHIYMDGEIPEEMHGNFAYLGSGIGLVTFNGYDEKEVKAVFKQRTFLSEREYKFTGHINYNCCKTDARETNYENNEDVHRFSVDATPCQTITPTVTITPPCVLGELQNRDAEKIYGLGQKYEWDVKFRWYQNTKDQYEATNVKYHIPVCDCHSYSVPDGTTTDSEGNTVTLYKRIEVLTYDCCHCYCEGGTSGKNNGVRKWRNADMGLGLYYEYHDLRIYCWSSAHGLRDISGGSTTVYTGESFYFYFDAIYTSNRDNMPNAPYYPEVQPYGTPYGGLGCPTCNILSRYPGVYNVAGPKKVRIQVSGTAGYNMDRVYNSPQYYLANGAVNKHYRWRPYQSYIHLQPTNVNQNIKLAISSYDFKGHYYDTSVSEEGTNAGKKAYAWYQRDKHVFCGTRTATIYLRPSKTYLGANSNEALGGALDSTTWEYGDGDAWVDGDTWVQ